MAKDSKAKKASKRAVVAAKTVTKAELTVHPEAEGFREKVTPKKPNEDVFFFKCKCGGIHLRHAGYAKVMVPFIKAGGKKEVAMQEERVMVCVACKKCYIWNGEQMYDVTDKIDLKAWEKTEREAHKATGPGGDC